MNQHRLVHMFPAALAILAFLIATPQAALAADRTPDISVPQKAQSVWVDIETPSASKLTFTGSLDNNGAVTNLEFKPSPSGTVAITDINPGTARLTLSASDSTEASVSITFVDDNDAVLEESTTPVTLEPAGALLKPSKPVAPNGQNQDAVSVAASDTATPNGNAKYPQTGSAVAIIAVAAIAFAAIGLVLLRIRKGANR